MSEHGQKDGVNGGKVITPEQWAQCENPSCEKWRLLPPGTVLNENEPWYCYMNPDPEKNTCDAPETVRGTCLFVDLLSRNSKVEQRTR